MNRTIFIAGGNTGIGYYLANHWLEGCNRVAVTDTATDNLDKLTGYYPNTLRLTVCDAADAEGVKAAVKEAAEAFGPIDAAVYGACACPFSSLDEMTLHDYRRALEVNFLGAVNLAKAVLPHMLAKKSGKIFLCGSGGTGFAGGSAYAASKAAVEAFVKCMRLEYKGSGVSFRILRPKLAHAMYAGVQPVPRGYITQARKVNK